MVQHGLWLRVGCCHEGAAQVTISFQGQLAITHVIVGSFLGNNN